MNQRFFCRARRARWDRQVRGVVGISLLLVLSILSACGETAAGTAGEATVQGARHFEPRWSHDPEWHPCSSVARPGVALVTCAPAPDRLMVPASRVRSTRSGSTAVALSTAAGAEAPALARLAARLREQKRRNPDDFAVENDLAVALALAAQVEERPASLIQALGAVERATNLAPGEPLVLFNRALVLTYLQLSEPAASAWRDYLRRDRTSPWAGEALGHLRRIERGRALRSNSAEGFASEVDAQLERHRLQEVVLADWSALDDRGEARDLLNRELPAVRRLAEKTGDRLLLESYQLLLAPHLDERNALHRDLREGHRLLAEANRMTRGQAFAESEPLFVRARALLTRSGSPFHLWAEHGLLRCAYHRTDYNEVEEIGQATLAKAEPGSAIAGRTWWVLGSARFGRGEFAPAEEAFHSAFEIFTRLDEGNNRIAVVSMLASLLDWIGREDDAWEARFVVLEALSDGHDPRRLRMVLIDAAYSAAAMGEAEAAILLQDLVVSIAEREGNPHSLANALLKRGALLERFGIGADERAGEDFQRSAVLIDDVIDSGDRFALRAQLLLEWGRSDSARGDAVTAIRRLTEARQLHDGDSPHLWLPEIHAELGRAQAAAGDDAAAEESLRTAIAELDRQRRSALGIFERVLLADRADGVHESLLRLLLDRGDVRQALAAVQWAHSDVWRTRTGQSVAPSPPLDDGALCGPTPVLTYALLADRLAMWLCRGDNVRFHDVEIARTELEALIANLRISLQTEGAGSLTLLRELYEILLAPFAAELAAFDHLSIAPDESLFGVPFAALVDPRGSYLIEKHAISIDASGGRRNGDSPAAAFAAPETLLAVADPEFPQHLHPHLDRLPAAREEAAAISKLYPSSELLTEHEATDVELLRRLTKADVIHLAAHGWSSARDPMNSSLVLAAATAEGDGLLTAVELLEIELPRQPIVVLASCESMGGFMSKSSGPIGLARPLLENGASSVVATLWEIDDEASREFVTRLHQGLADGERSREALRDAQLRAIAGGRLVRSWGPWVTLVTK